MSTVRVATHFNIDIEFTAPPFHRRLAAWIIDVVILVFYLVIASRLSSWLSEQIGSGDGAGVMLWAINLLVILPFLLYHLVMEATVDGQSLGKKIMSIKVISEAGSKPSLGQLIIRWLVRTSDYMLLVIIVLFAASAASGQPPSSSLMSALTLALGLLVTDLILVNTRKHQRLGDILAHTVLINTKRNEKISDTVFLDVAGDYSPRFPQIMHLSDRDINALKGIIVASRRDKDSRMAEVAAEKIKTHLNIQTDLEAKDFLDVLLKDYNFLSTH